MKKILSLILQLLLPKPHPHMLRAEYHCLHRTPTRRLVQHPNPSLQ